MFGTQEMSMIWYDIISVPKMWCRALLTSKKTIDQRTCVYSEGHLSEGCVCMCECVFMLVLEVHACVRVYAFVCLRVCVFA